MTTEEIKKLAKMMMQMFNDGYEQVIVPRLEGLEEKIDEMKRELTEEFRAGQQSLSNRIEELDTSMGEMNKKMDQIVKSDSEQNRRLDKIERIIKAN